MTIEIWATGTRAFCQLDLVSVDDISNHECEEQEDVTSYTKILACDGIRVQSLRAGQYRVHVQTLRSGQYLIGGHEDVVLEMIEAANIGAADSSEYLERYSRYAGLIDHHLRAIIKGGFFAMSGTGRIVDLSGVQSQIQNTSSGPIGIPLEATIPLPGIGMVGHQIVAGATHFAALIDNSVYTWGDPRYPAPLGRMDPESRLPDSPPTSLPGIVYDLEDLEDDEKVVKIAAGGYLTAALTKGGDCYIWGAQELGWSGRPEPLDFKVVDVAVGEECVVLIVEMADGGRGVMVRGRSRHGELGLGDDFEKVEEWTEVPLDVPEGAQLLQAVAGAKCVLLEIWTRTPASAI